MSAKMPLSPSHFRVQSSTWPRALCWAAFFARAASSRCGEVAKAAYLLARGRRLRRRLISPRPMRAAGRVGGSRRPVLAMAAPLVVDGAAAVVAAVVVARLVVEAALGD